MSAVVPALVGVFGAGVAVGMAISGRVRPTIKVTVIALGAITVGLAVLTIDLLK